MNIKVIYLATFLTINTGYQAVSQTFKKIQVCSDCQETHKTIHTHYHWEYALAGYYGNVTATNEKDLGIRFHFLKRFEAIKRLRFGAGSSMIFTDNKYYKFNGVIAYEFHKGWQLNYNPGIQFIETFYFNTEGPAQSIVKIEETNAEFAQHFELIYEFEWHKFHFGPMVRYGFSKFGSDFMGGLNLAFDFDFTKNGLEKKTNYPK